jgi:hypothetical protein
LLVGNPAYTTGLTLLPSLLFSVRVEELDWALVCCHSVSFPSLAFLICWMGMTALSSAFSRTDCLPGLCGPHVKHIQLY